MHKPPRQAGPAPSRGMLHEAALRHLARFATTEAGLVRILDRRVQRWARLAAAEGADVQADVAEARLAVRSVAHALVRAGAVDDVAFATARAGRLARAGRSRRATSAHLAAKGVPPAVADAALLPPEHELSSALAYARRRRLGPFRLEATEDTRLRDRGALARAGFPRDVVEQAMGMGLDQASALVTALKRG